MAAARSSAVTPLRIVIPRGRSAAERRLGAIAALHQPVPDKYRIYGDVCGECGDGRSPWPCATARLLGEWPGGEGADE